MELLLDLKSIWSALGPNAAFRIANQTRPSGEYLFNGLLPEKNLFGYEVRGGRMIVRPTMAGLVGMDSPYPEGGAISVSSFMQNTAKVANRVRLSEAMQRELQQLDIYTRATGGSSLEDVRNRLLNFYSLLVIQPNMDTFEYLRGRSVMTGVIDWTFNDIHLSVDYQQPSGNKIAQRTGTARYNGSASVFWADMRAARKLLNGRVRATLMSDTTAWEIFDNPVNNIAIVSETEINRVTKQYVIGRRITETVDGTTVIRTSEDKRDTFTITTYSAEVEKIDLATAGKTVKLPVIKDGEWAMIGIPTQTFLPGDGAVGDTLRQVGIFGGSELGYTHIGPTTEGGGAPGRWGKAGQPEGEEWAFEGKCAANGLPIIEFPELIVNGSTALS